LSTVEEQVLSTRAVFKRSGAAVEEKKENKPT